jgi:hypothetical protein
MSRDERNNQYAELKELLCCAFQNLYEGKFEDENMARLTFTLDVMDYIAFYMRPGDEV